MSPACGAPLPEIVAALFGPTRPGCCEQIVAAAWCSLAELRGGVAHGRHCGDWFGLQLILLRREVVEDLKNLSGYFRLEPPALAVALCGGHLVRSFAAVFTMHQPDSRTFENLLHV